MTLEKFRKITKENQWSDYAHLLLNQNNYPLETIEQFGTCWIESGHRIREQIADDRILVLLLRHMLPTYEGNSVKLFRGEHTKGVTSCNITLCELG